MKTRSEEKNAIRLKVILAIFIIVLLSASCTDRNSRHLIPEKSFSAILTEVYLADGLIAVVDIQNLFAGRDTAFQYVDIIESHGYSKEQMENTLRYYFKKKPKKLIKIYDRAIGKLSEIESLLQNNPNEIPVTKANLWTGELFYFLPDTLKNNKIFFDTILTSPGLYTIEFCATVYPDDQSFNPQFTAWTCNSDSLKTGRNNYLPALRYLKDGNPRTYTITFRVQNKTSVILKGYLYDYGNNPDQAEVHARIEEISISFTPDLS